MKPGDKVTVYGPFGEFFAKDTDAEMIFIGGGVAVIEVPGGGQVAARGEAAVGQRAFFRDGVIEGVAPDLTIVEVEI